jgi:hypothetical protein
MKQLLELVIRYIGFGARCTHCNRLRKTTRYTLRNGRTEELIQQILLCDVCVALGFVAKFFVDAPSNISKGDRRKRVRISRELEEELAEDMGGKVQPGSGNMDAKADVRVFGKWRLEHKYTDSVSGYTLSVSDLNAIIQHANMAGELPGLVTVFRKIKKRKFITLPFEVFQQLKEAYETSKH